MKSFFLILFTILGAIAGLTSPALAGGPIGISPAKIELTLAPGESTTKQITLSNQTSSAFTFTVTVADFVAGTSATEPVRVLTDATTSSPYSLQQDLKIEAADRRFTLVPGSTRIIPVTITLPVGISGGARYGTVLFSAVRNEAGAVSVQTTIGALFFVRVAGPASTQGEVSEFGVKPIKSNQPPVFDVLFENVGDMYLNPYGYITVRNWLNQEVAFIPIDPWFVMPHSLRLRTLTANAPLGSGWYHATLKLNRGYDNVIDTKEINFFVWSWPVFGGVIVGLIIAWWLGRKLLWRRK